ncbi:MAG: LON peptidase substrate-binding domain-containing protein [Burkholderiaceae bacterium]
MATDPDPALALFPLQAVLFPGGLLSLKVFEARYLDLIGSCLREHRTFGVVALRSGAEVRRAGTAVQFESVGTRAELIDVDSKQSGILQVRCRGTRRFHVDAHQQQDDGLWLARTSAIGDDATLAPPPALLDTVRGLANAITTLSAQHTQLFLEPYRFDDAGWVANRWCEILPIPQAAKQKLMELPDPIARLRLVDDFLRSKGVVA